MSHVYANESTIRFSTLIKPNKRFTIMEPIGIAIRPKYEISKRASGNFQP